MKNQPVQNKWLQNKIPLSQEARKSVADERSARRKRPIAAKENMGHLIMTTISQEEQRDLQIVKRINGKKSVGHYSRNEDF